MTMVTQYRLMAHLSRWLAERGLGAADLTAARVDEFLAAQRGGGYGHACTVRGLDSLLGALRDAGLTPAAVAVPGSAREVVLAEFRVFLLAERGLAASTSDAYVARADRFLGWVAPARWCASQGRCLWVRCRCSSRRCARSCGTPSSRVW